MFRGGKLVACDPGGETPDWTDDASLDTRPTNNRLVIYELPTAWSLRGETGDTRVGVGTFRDVLALVEPDEAGANFAGDRGPGAWPRAPSGARRQRAGAAAAGRQLRRARVGLRHQQLLRRRPRSRLSRRQPLAHAVNRPGRPGQGLPPARHPLLRRHGDGVRHPRRRTRTSTSRTSTSRPARTTRRRTTRASSTRTSAATPSAATCSATRAVANGYDPVSGQTRQLVPARRLMLAYLARWMHDFRIDGVRMDSVVNFASWEFIRDFKEHGRALWRERYADAGLPACRCRRPLPGHRRGAGRPARTAPPAPAGRPLERALLAAVALRHPGPGAPTASRASRRPSAS